jgi:hypothetical protein
MMERIEPHSGTLLMLAVTVSGGHGMWDTWSNSSA